MPDSKVIILIDNIIEAANDGAEAVETPPVPETFAAALDMATAVAASEKGRVLVLSVVEVPAEKSLTEGTLGAQSRRHQIAAWNRTWATAYRAAYPGENGGDPLPDIQPLVTVAPQGEYWLAIADAIGREECSLMLVPLRPGDLAGQTDALDQELSCDLALLRPGSSRADQPSYFASTRILLPARGGPHANLSLRLARALVAGRGAELTMLHVYQQDLPERQRSREERPFAELVERAGLDANIKQEYEVGRSVADAILNHAREYDAVLMGAPATKPAQGGPLGRVSSAIAEKAEAALLVVKTGIPAEPAIRAILRRGGEAPELGPKELSLVVDKWFAENTFNSEEFADLEQLVQLKRQRGVTISLGLPTLNEEATIGEIISILKKALMEDVPLLDEIVLIDSASTDRTVEIAREHGIPVYVHQEILPEAGPPLRGKGEALWKSLHVLSGDIIAWVDTDVSNMHPRFVYGLIGPLLLEPRVMYTKGYYHRPLRVGDKLLHEGGGRVTELTIRPLFNLFFPLLSGLVQPLAGEYAGRRELLERLPFFSGYGVETGLLIDILEEYGLSAIGQVNLGERVHRNQSLANLSLMGFALMQVIISRLEEHARVHIMSEVNRSMKLIRFEADRLSLDVREVRDVERPPIRTIPAYRRGRARMKMPNR